MPADGSTHPATDCAAGISAPRYVPTRDGQVVDLTNPDFASVLTIENAYRILRLAAVGSVKVRQHGGSSTGHDETILSLAEAIRLAGKTAADRLSA